MKRSGAYLVRFWCDLVPAWDALANGRGFERSLVYGKRQQLSYATD